MGKFYAACFFFALMAYTAITSIIDVVNADMLSAQWWWSTVFSLLGLTFALYWFVVSFIQAGTLLIEGLNAPAEDETGRAE